MLFVYVHTARNYQYMQAVARTLLEHHLSSCVRQMRMVQKLLTLYDVVCTINAQDTKYGLYL